MGHKRILFAAADVDAVADVKRVFLDPWEVVTVASGPDALKELDREAFDVLVADLDLPGLDGAALLNETRNKHSRTLCFILANDADRERVMENVVGAHQFLTKPCDPSVLKNHIERALSLDTWVASNRMRELVARVRTFPTVPTLYLEVLTALKSPNATTEQVGKIIARDMAMMTKLLQVINSACFGLPRKISDPVEAVGLIGFDAVKSMVMTIKLLNQYDKIKPVYFSIDRLWRHSTDVARSAKQLTLMHTDNAAMGEAAFTAGLLHDIGKVVLAANFDEQYRGAQSLAAKQKLPLAEVEKEIFGASHGEIGAYLLGLWGMPLDLLECAALHHHPSRVVSREFSTLTAVHVANVLEHEATPESSETASLATIDEEYLTKVGVLDQLETWRVAVLRRQFTKPAKPLKMAHGAPAETKPKEHAPAAAAPKAKLAPAATSRPAPAPVATEPAGSPWFLRPAVGVGIGLVIVALVVWFFLPSSSKQPALDSGQPSAPEAVTQETPAKTVVESTPPAHSDTSLLAPLPVRARTAEPQSNAASAATNAPAPTVAKAPAPAPAPVRTFVPSNLDAMKLQGILYSPSGSSAIINGETLHQGELISGLHVIEITPTSVTLEYGGRRRTLRLE